MNCCFNVIVSGVAGLRKGADHSQNSNLTSSGNGKTLIVTKMAFVGKICKCTEKIGQKWPILEVNLQIARRMAYVQLIYSTTILGLFYAKQNQKNKKKKNVKTIDRIFEK